VRPEPGITARCVVKKVVDGDTLDVELKIPVRIRLLDCWAPEARSKDKDEKVLGLAAKANLIACASGRTGVVCIPTGQADSVSDVLTLDRILGMVWVDGEDDDLSSTQVANGFASSKKGGPLGH
jgi:endonuclease YncB( thermonuclease family)